MRPNLRRGAPYDFEDRPLSFRARRFKSEMLHMRIFGSLTKFQNVGVSCDRTSPARFDGRVARSCRRCASQARTRAPIRSLSKPTDEMPIVREISARHPAVTAPDVSSRRPAPSEDGDSDVFVCRRSSPDSSAEAAAAAAAAAEGVTLFVYGWENVEPGPLSWAFPSLRTALDAVKTMRNAIEWCIVAGHEWVEHRRSARQGRRPHRTERLSYRDFPVRSETGISDIGALVLRAIDPTSTRVKHMSASRR